MAAASRLLVRCAPLTFVLLLVFSAPAMAQWQIGDEAKTSIKFVPAEYHSQSAIAASRSAREA